MMRPFSLELAYLAGWHDGERVHIAEPDDPHVVIHEDVHADILRTTPDGQLLWFSILLASHSNQAMDFIEQHVAQSRRAHECFATYVGSKSFVQKVDRLSAKQSLNDEYQDYYRVMGDILAPVVTSDFFKVALAMAILQVVFSSRALHSWAAMGFDDRALVQEVSNDRLDVFCSWWSRTGSHETKAFLHSCVEEQDWILSWAKDCGLDGSLVDFIDNDDRLLEDRAFCRDLDAYLIPHLIAHFFQASPLAVISEAEWQEALEWVVREAERRDIPLELEPGYDDLRAGDYRMSATADARTYIRASSLERVQSAAQIDDLRFRRALAASQTIVGVMVRPDDDDAPDRCDIEALKIVSSGDEHAIDTDLMSLSWMATESTVAGLLGHADAVLDGGETKNLGCILVPVSRPDIIRRLDACALNRELCVYLDKDVFEFTLGHATEFEFGFVPFEARGDLTLTAFWGRPKHTGSPHVLKCMPSEAGRLFFAHLIRRGDVAVVDAYPPNIVREAVRLAKTYWNCL